MALVSNEVADFDTFEPVDYLTEYYSSIGSENDALLAFLARAYAPLPLGSSLLEVGGGPTVYQLIAAAGREAIITFADPVIANHEAVIDWIERRPAAFDWSPYVHRALQYEGYLEPSPAAISEREDDLRSALRHRRLCDVLAALPLGEPTEPFDAVGSHFVTESITDDRTAWERGLANLVGLVRPGGRFVLSSLLGATSWRSGERVFPAVSLSVADVISGVEDLGIDLDVVEEADAQTGGTASADHQGYDGMLFLAGFRRR